MGCLVPRSRAAGGLALDPAGGPEPLAEKCPPAVTANAGKARCFAAQVAVRGWSTADPPMPLGPLLRRALEQLATVCSGLPAGG
jgi:hypothetical protein